MRKGNLCKEQTPRFHRYISMKKSSKEGLNPILSGKEKGQCQENRSILCLFASFFHKEVSCNQMASTTQAERKKNKRKNSELQDTEFIENLF